MKKYLLPFLIGQMMLIPFSLLAQYNYFAGTNAGAVNTGPNNTFVGAYSGENNTYADNNAFFGTLSGNKNTVGVYNMFSGSLSGYSNTNGIHNAYMGYGTGRFNQSGSYNTIAGSTAGYNNTGSNNSFFGYSSGFENTSGYSNAFFGAYSGKNTSTGSNNSYFGYAAGYLNTTGSYNSLFGYAAGYNNSTGSGNSLFGYRSGYSNTSGTNNSFFGYATGTNNTTGGGNSFIGYNAGAKNTTGGGNNFIGDQAGVVNTIGNFNNIIGGYAGYKNNSGSYNCILGYASGFGNTSGGKNTFLGYSAGGANISGSGNTMIGYFANIASGALTNATAIGNLAYVTASNSVVLGSINGKNGATVNAKVGIGTTAPAYQLQLSTNSAAKPGSSSWIVASDKKLKKDIEPFKDGLEVLKKMNPVKYHYNGKAGMPDDKEFIGVIAQDVQKIAPYMVGTFHYQDTSGKKEDFLDYDATALSYILVNAVKEQEKIIEEKNGQIELLEKRISDLEEKMFQIERFITNGTPYTGGSGSEARLWQNEPNPANGYTVIRYFIPEKARAAQLAVYAMSGKIVSVNIISTRGLGSVNISPKNLAGGTYTYTLTVDGKTIDSKKMILAR